MGPFKLKILILCLTLGFTATTYAIDDGEDFDDTPSLNEVIVQRLEGLYQTVDKEGRNVSILVVRNSDANLLEMHQSVAGDVNTILDMPLLIQDMTPWRAKVYKNQNNAVTVIDQVIEHQILNTNQFLRLKIDTHGSKRTSESRLFTLTEEDKLIQKVSVDEYKRKLPLVDKWEALSHTDTTLTFTKIHKPITFGHFLHQATMEKKRLKQAQNIGALTENQSTPVSIANQEAAVSKVVESVKEAEAAKKKDEIRGEVIDWIVPEKSSFNFFPADHSAKIISQDKFNEYRNRKRCDLLLEGKIDKI